jgi:hypothetical protein
MNTTGSRNLKKLRPIHHHCMRLLVERGESGGSVADVARKLGFKRVQTISDWRASPVFKREFEKLKAKWDSELEDEFYIGRRARFRVLAEQLANLRDLATAAESVSEAAACARAVGDVVERLGKMVGDAGEQQRRKPPVQSEAAEAFNSLTRLMEFADQLDYYCSELQADSMTVSEFTRLVRCEAGE